MLSASKLAKWSSLRNISRTAYAAAAPPVLSRDFRIQTNHARHARTFASTSIAQQQPPFGRRPGGDGLGGFPGVNMYGQGGRTPGETLKENSIDLTELAEQNKLDPVIGMSSQLRTTTSG